MSLNEVTTQQEIYRKIADRDAVTNRVLNEL